MNKNKQDLIEKIRELDTYGSSLIERNEVLELIRQLDEPEKIVVPQLIANWIEVAKPTYSLYGAMVYGSPGVNKWLENWNNQETFVLAWIFGYEIEKEPKYIVKFKGFNPRYIILKHHQYDDTWFLGGEQECEFYRTHHTRKELEQAGFGWVFSCEGIEIEEVTE